MLLQLSAKLSSFCRGICAYNIPQKTQVHRRKIGIPEKHGVSTSMQDLGWEGREGRKGKEGRRQPRVMLQHFLDGDFLLRAANVALKVPYFCPINCKASSPLFHSSSCPAEQSSTRHLIFHRPIPPDPLRIILTVN